MDTITLNEALIAGLIERGGVDAGNAIPLLRNAQKRLAAQVYPVPLDQPLDIDVVDGYMIYATANGRVDLYAEVTA